MGLHVAGADQAGRTPLRESVEFVRPRPNVLFSARRFASLDVIRPSDPAEIRRPEKPCGADNPQVVVDGQRVGHLQRLRTVRSVLQVRYLRLGITDCARVAVGFSQAQFLAAGMGGVEARTRAAFVRIGTQLDSTANVDDEPARTSLGGRTHARGLRNAPYARPCAPQTSRSGITAGLSAYRQAAPAVRLRCRHPMSRCPRTPSRAWPVDSAPPEGSPRLCTQPFLGARPCIGSSRVAPSSPR